MQKTAREKIKKCAARRYTRGAYHLARKFGNFGLKSKGFRSKRNGGNFLYTIAKLSSFQSFISQKQLREIELQMVSAISFGWFADFGKTLTIIQRSSQPASLQSMAELDARAEPFLAPFSFNFLDISRACTCHTLQTGQPVYSDKW